jgi:hypothetical protein
MQVRLRDRLLPFSAPPEPTSGSEEMIDDLPVDCVHDLGSGVCRAESKEAWGPLRLPLSLHVSFAVLVSIIK